MRYLYRLITQEKRDPLSLLGKLFLCGCSFIYYLGIRFILGAYKIRMFARYKLSCTVISVGNITWGGTGKTPLVEMLARWLDVEGHKVAILSRGYKKARSSKLEPACSPRCEAGRQGRAQSSNYQNMGDEPYLLKKNLPHIPVLVGRDRVVTGREAVREYNVDTIILDDGFQYWRLFRNLEIVTINAFCPFGNGRVLPRGILREPLSSLRRADIFMLTKTDLGKDNLSGLKERLTRINPKALIVESVHQPVYIYSFDGAKVDLSELNGKAVCLLSGIADPASFEKSVSNLGAAIALKFRFPDHYAYQLEDIKKITNACIAQDIKTIITTEKDAVRLSAFSFQLSAFNFQLLILRIEIKITKNEQKFFNRLNETF